MEALLVIFVYAYQVWDCEGVDGMAERLVTMRGSGQTVFAKAPSVTVRLMIY